MFKLSNNISFLPILDPSILTATVDSKICDINKNNNFKKYWIKIIMM